MIEQDRYLVFFNKISDEQTNHKITEAQQKKLQDMKI